MIDKDLINEADIPKITGVIKEVKVGAVTSVLEWDKSKSADDNIAHISGQIMQDLMEGAIGTGLIVLTTGAAVSSLPVVIGGFVKSCNALASHYLKKNLAKAKDYLTTACESNYYKSCHSLALIYHEQKDYKKAWVLFNKACEKGAINEACFAKASRYLNGVGVEKDYFKAELIFTRLCKENVKTSCQIIEDIKNYKVRDTDLYKNAKNKYLNEQLKRNYTVDLKTKLMWQDYKESKIIKLNFKKAKEYCEDLMVGGFNNWRLPTAKEMSTLFNTKNHAFKKFIKNPKNNETYWLFNFNHIETKKGFRFRKFPSNVVGINENGLLYVRCVRDTTKNKVEK